MYQWHFVLCFIYSGSGKTWGISTSSWQGIVNWERAKKLTDLTVLGGDSDPVGMVQSPLCWDWESVFFLCRVCRAAGDGLHAEQFNQTSNLAWREKCFL